MLDAGIAHRLVDDEPSTALTVLTARQAKGLEFDVVCVAEPEEIAAGGLSDLRALYVAYTRATQTLIVAHQGGDPLAEYVPGRANPSGMTIATRFLGRRRTGHRAKWESLLASLPLTGEP